MVDEIDADMRLFADDCVCYRTVKNIQDCSSLQDDMNHLAAWAKTGASDSSRANADYAHYKKDNSQDHPPILYGEQSSRICFLYKVPWSNNLGRPKVESPCGKGNLSC